MSWEALMPSCKVASHIISQGSSLTHSPEPGLQ